MRKVLNIFNNIIFNNTQIPWQYSEKALGSNPRADWVFLSGVYMFVLLSGSPSWCSGFLPQIFSMQNVDLTHNSEVLKNML